MGLLRHVSIVFFWLYPTACITQQDTVLFSEVTRARFFAFRGFVRNRNTTCREFVVVSFLVFNPSFLRTVGWKNDVTNKTFLKNLFLCILRFLEFIVIDN